MAEAAPRAIVAEPPQAVSPPDSLGPDSLLKLLTFLSPGFPVGSFAYSHGLEWLIESHAIGNAAALQAWLADLLACGSLRMDALLFAEAYRAAGAGDWPRLLGVAELAEALAGSRERHVETMAQGRAFLAAVANGWGCDPLERLVQAEGAPYAVAVAALAAGQSIPLRSALPAFLNAVAASLVSVGVRLVPLGQGAGLEVLAALHPLIAATAARALTSSRDDLGAATVLSDIASMRHETQYSRVFRT